MLEHISMEYDPYMNRTTINIQYISSHSAHSINGVHDNHSLLLIIAKISPFLQWHRSMGTISKERIYYP